MKILIATPEAVPFAKTGGLADVTGSLLKEYTAMKQQACLIMPLYKKIKENFRLKNTGLKIKVPVGSRNLTGRIFSDASSQADKPSAYFIDCEEFFNRDELYGTPQGDYPDNSSRFIFFSRGILEACKALEFKPDIIHCNDWQTGLVPLYLKTIYRTDKFFSGTVSVITVHNLGYQGVFPSSEMQLTGLDSRLFNPEGIEFYGKVNFLKAGLIAADSITTVSNTYAREILSSEYGFGLDGVLRKRASVLSGIINGIDYKEWDPQSDSFIPFKFSDKAVAGKKKCKQQLLKDCAIKSDAGKPLIGMVGRLSSQKGLDIVLEAIGDIISAGASLVVLGKGDEIFHKKLYEAAEAYKGRVYVKTGFEDSLAHRIYAGSDIFLMPSRYEPCGLGQLIAMRYGTIPVARKTGGLADTIIDYEPMKGNGTGFLFSDYTSGALYSCLKMAFCVYADNKRWQKLTINAMKMDFSWGNSAQKYVELYDRVIKLKRT